MVRKTPVVVKPGSVPVQAKELPVPQVVVCPTPPLVSKLGSIIQEANILAEKMMGIPAFQAEEVVEEMVDMVKKAEPLEQASSLEKTEEEEEELEETYHFLLVVVVKNFV